MKNPSGKIVVLGAAGLIGNFIAGDMMRRGLDVVGVARRFTDSEQARFGAQRWQRPVVDLSAAALSDLLKDADADIVVNCIGVLQDTASGSTEDVHHGFAGRLLTALRALPRPSLLIHLSIPGRDPDDTTAFARTKRAADREIIRSGLPYVILRPGFVVAPAAYGGSALLRALAVLPLDLPRDLASRPFGFIAIEDVGETVAVLAQQWRSGDVRESLVLDLMHPNIGSLGDVLSAMRAWLGGGFRRRLEMPDVVMTLGTSAGDLSAWLGWRPPVRSTAIAELRRGVTGDAKPWLAATGIAPRALNVVFRDHPATIQEKWFARLYLLKALVLVGLVLFWCASALIALTVAYPAAVAILTSHGYSNGAAQFMTVAGSVMDFCIGIAIAFRRTCRWGLAAGIAVSLFYMGTAAILTPELWIEPLGALVKTGPAIILMLVALAIADDR